jgi:uncharacterized protein YdaU (DUF1376 family)
MMENGMFDVASASLSLRMINAPPVPAGCTMEGMEYMPLHDERLRSSRAWLRARRNPAIGFYLMNLWTAAWKGTPAGSLEDDDDVLADAAMCSPAEWEAVREETLRGWLRCREDGRLYHPFVCEVAREVWEKRVSYRERTATARSAKAEKRERARQSTLNFETKNDTEISSAARNGNEPKPAEKADVVVEMPSVTDAKCESLRSNKGEAPPLPPSSSRGSALDPDWLPGGEGCHFAARLGLDPQETVDAFTDHYRAAPGLRGRSRDWHATWREWCRREVAYRSRSSGKPEPATGLLAAYARQRRAEVWGEAA